MMYEKWKELSKKGFLYNELSLLSLFMWWQVERNEKQEMK